MVAWVLVCAVVLILVMPPIAKWLNLPNNWAGAWVGGVIDNTGAVVAAVVLAEHYGIESSPGDTFTKVILKPEHRRGGGLPGLPPWQTPRRAPGGHRGCHAPG